MPGKTYHPLETVGQPSELDRFRRAAKEGGPLEELVGLTLVDTGLRNGEVAHMQESWLDLESDQPEINIPLGEVCTLGKGEGKGGDTTQTGEPCYYCRRRPEKEWAPDWADFTPKSENGQRPVPIRDEDTLQALQNYFTVYDQVCSINTVTERVKDIAARADLDREVTPHDLRDTYGTRLAMKGFGPHEIKDLMGHANLKQALDYVKLSGQQVHSRYDELW